MNILFVCTGNACRSPAAEALLKQAELNLHVDSAGTHPHYEITEITRTYLRQHHADRFLKGQPESVASKDLDTFDLIVAMESCHCRFLLQHCPQCSEKIEVWNISDPYFLDPESATRVYDSLKQKVTKLILTIRDE
jgi:protein-tyrosine-phosphatase